MFDEAVFSVGLLTAGDTDEPCALDLIRNLRGVPEEVNAEQEQTSFELSATYSGINGNYI